MKILNLFVAKPTVKGQTDHQSAQNDVYTINATEQQPTYEHLHSPKLGAEPSQYQSLSTSSQENTKNCVYEEIQ